MSTVSAAHEGKSSSLGATHFLLRRLHSLTGIVFGLYLCVHLLVNATLIEGVHHGATDSVFQVQVDKIHSLPFLMAVEWTLIYLPILYHTVYGIFIVVTGQPNVGHYAYAKNWAYFFQRVSAMILVLFIAFHVLTMKGLLGSTSPYTFEPGNATASTVRHLTASPWIAYGVYPIGILAACFHLANGFWTAAITWGLTVSRESQKRFGGVCVLVFLFTFGCGMTAWFAGITADQSNTKPVPAHVSGEHD